MSFSELLVVIIVLLVIFKPDTLKAMIKKIKPAMDELRETKDDLKEVVQPAKEMADEVTKPAQELANELAHPLSGGSSSSVSGTVPNNVINTADQQKQTNDADVGTVKVQASGQAPEAPAGNTDNT